MSEKTNAEKAADILEELKAKYGDEWSIKVNDNYEDKKKYKEMMRLMMAGFQDVQSLLGGTNLFGSKK